MSYAYLPYKNKVYFPILKIYHKFYRKSNIDFGILEIMGGVEIKGEKMKMKLRLISI